MQLQTPPRVFQPDPDAVGQTDRPTGQESAIHIDDRSLDVAAGEVRQRQMSDGQARIPVGQ